MFLKCKKYNIEKLSTEFEYKYDRKGLRTIFFIMHPLRGPKGGGVAPIGAMRGCISVYLPFLVTI